MLKPLIPILCDVWAHSFNEIEHISTVHAKYGSHHLQNELGNSGATNSDKNSNNLRPEEQVPFHVLVNEYKIYVHSSIEKQQFGLLIYFKFPSGLIPCEGPPPKFI